MPALGSIGSGGGGGSLRRCCSSAVAAGCGSGAPLRVNARTLHPRVGAVAEAAPGCVGDGRLREGCRGGAVRLPADAAAL